jgi:nucleoside-diphosphate-sugar epimerase
MTAGAYQMKNRLLSLIGCGWLGTELLNRLKEQDYQLIATTAHAKADNFIDPLVSYHQLDLSKNPSIPQDILNSEVLIYLIPPLSLDHIKIFFDQIPLGKKIIFISSTSVYGKHLGKADEETALSPSTLLLETETYLRERFSKATILRLGGLYGKSRHPIYQLAGKSGLKTGEEFLHLTHQDDGVNAILSVLKNEIWNETINIVSDLRIKKKVYYTAIAQKLSLVPPQYIPDENNYNPTQISNEKSKRLLNLTYKDPNEFYTFSE